MVIKARASEITILFGCDIEIVSQRKLKSGHHANFESEPTDE